MSGLFTSRQIDELRAGFGHVGTIDPRKPSYQKLIALLDGMTVSQLRQIEAENIRFLSKLARNRLPGA